MTVSAADLVGAPAPADDAPKLVAVGEPGPFDGWVGVLVPVGDDPRRTGGRNGGCVAEPKLLLLVPPNLLAALRGES